MKSSLAFLGCLLGGAVGNALAAPVAVMGRKAVLDRYGPAGVTGYAPAFGRTGAVTADTQMTLFTAEGILSAHARWLSHGLASVTGMISISYGRWMYTQEHDGPPAGPLGMGDSRVLSRLTGMRELYRRRLPGAACLAALKGGDLSGSGPPPANSSRGCGAVVRMSPVGLASDSPDRIMSEAVSAAALTHGDPGGQVPAAAFALIIHHLAGGSGIRAAVAEALGRLDRLKDHNETSSALELAVRLASGDLPPAEAHARLGNGAAAPGALAAAVYCAFMARDFREGALMAVNRDGNPMGPAALAGGMLGCLHGVSGIPREWLDGLELADVIAEVALDLYTCGGWNISGMGQASGYEDSWALSKYLFD